MDRSVQASYGDIGRLSDLRDVSITVCCRCDEVERRSRSDSVQTLPGTAGSSTEQLLERIDYSYDAKGQRTAKNTLNNHGTGQGETPMEATYDTSNRMLSITLKPGADASTHTTWNLSYDANGNLTQKANAANSAEVTTYTWDSENRLTGLSKTEGGQTTTASFQYDLFGRRISSSIQQGAASPQNPPQTVQFLYEGQQALGEIRSGSLSHRLITGLSLDETIARIAIAGSGAVDIPASRQYLTDALNSVIAQANAQGGGIANSYGYSAYGESQTVGPDATGNTAQYTSRENDAQGATGLYFYRARYYDPVLKRFISEDPIGLAGGMNLYGYVGGDPVSFSDPTGKVKWNGTMLTGGGDLGVSPIGVGMIIVTLRSECKCGVRFTARYRIVFGEVGVSTPLVYFGNKVSLDDGAACPSPSSLTGYFSGPSFLAAFGAGVVCGGMTMGSGQSGVGCAAAGGFGGGISFPVGISKLLWAKPEKCDCE